MQTSNIITPPDFINDGSHSVLMIDPVQAEVEAVALYCSSVDVVFNIYVYLAEMNDTEWLVNVLPRVDAVIINTVPNGISGIKDKIAVQPNAYYYGPKRFLMNPKQVKNTIEYFAEYSR